MKYLYSKADRTYAWIGRQELDDAMTALNIYRGVSINTMALGNLIYRHTQDPPRECQRRPWAVRRLSLGAAYSSDRQPQYYGDECQRSVLEYLFAALLVHFNPDYWKRHRGI